MCRLPLPLSCPPQALPPSSPLTFLFLSARSAQFGSNNYGTSKATIEEQTAKGQVVVLDIEMEGVKQVKKSSIEARYVFISPPSEAELEKRLRGRGTESEDSVQQRLARAKEELAWSKTTEFDRVLVNDDLEKTFAELDEFVYSAPKA